MKYKKYPSYKDSGVEWLGEIPTEWEMWKVFHAFNYLYNNESLNEGDMSKKRASFVCEDALYEYSKYINYKPYIRVGHGQMYNVNETIVADIFEALTASDRPYKKGNPLSSAMKILYFMAKEDELDKELVKFFYNSGLYLRYAKELLPESSIDEVTVDFSTL